MDQHEYPPHLSLEELIEHVGFTSAASIAHLARIGSKDEWVEATDGLVFAINEIHDAMQRGKLPVKGHHKGRATLEDIPLNDIIDGRIDVLNGELNPSDPFKQGAVVWERLIFVTEEVLELWPAPLESTAGDAEPDPHSTGLPERPAIAHHRAGEPRPETIERRKEDYETIERLMNTHNCGPTEAAKMAYEPGKRSADAIEMGWRRHTKYLEGAAERQDGNLPPE